MLAWSLLAAACAAVTFGVVILAVVTLALAVACAWVCVYLYGVREGYLDADGDEGRAGRTRRRAEYDQHQHVTQRVADVLAGLGGLTADPQAGFVYIVRFNTGGVKVGLTVDPVRRLGEHVRDARRFGVEVTGLQVSDPHANFAANETVLIARCRQLATPVRKGYFPALPFDDAAALMAELTYLPPTR